MPFEMNLQHPLRIQREGCEALSSNILIFQMMIKIFITNLETLIHLNHNNLILEVIKVATKVKKFILINKICTILIKLQDKNQNNEFNYLTGYNETLKLVI